MKFIYTALAFLITINLISQESILFQPEFKENSKYITTMDMRTLSSSIQIKDSVSTEMPTMEMTMDMVLAQITESKDANGSIPMIITYDSMSITAPGVEQSMDDLETSLKDIKVYAKINDGFKVTIDSLTGADSDPMIQQTIGQAMEQITGAVQFPDHAIKIGDSFEQDLSQLSSISAQMPGATMTITYTLESIANDMAHFSTVLFLKGEMGEMMKMNGDGKGSMTFDMKNKYVSNNDQVMTMIMNMTMGEQEMRMEMKMDQKMNIQLQQ